MPLGDITIDTGVSICLHDYAKAKEKNRKRECNPTHGMIRKYYESKYGTLQAHIAMRLSIGVDHRGRSLNEFAFRRHFTSRDGTLTIVEPLHWPLAVPCVQETFVQPWVCDWS